MIYQVKRAKKIVSQITIVQCNGDHEIRYIRTSPEHRLKGYASKLIEKAKTKFPSLVAFLDDDGTGLTVEQMIRWYKRHGFKRIRYKFGKPWDRSTKFQWVMYWETNQADEGILEG